MQQYYNLIQAASEAAGGLRGQFLHQYQVIQPQLHMSPYHSWLKLPGWGRNWDTVTGLLKVTAIFRNCIVTGLHFQNKKCIGTWGYLIAGKVTLLLFSG